MSKEARTRLLEGLFGRSLALFDRLPIHPEPQLMDYISTVLERAVVQERDATIGAYRSVMASEPLAFTTIPGGGDAPVGMNTAGLLLDRLSIQAIKYWKMKHHYGKASEAEHLYETQVREMIATLSVARRGFSDITSKITNQKYTATAETFPEALYGLLSANLLLWESQEVVYTRDAMTLPEAELRSYITYFSLQNLLRNAFMDLVDRLFWKAVDEQCA